MISPELLRRYPFFGQFDDAQLKSIAMLAEESSFEKATRIFNEGDPANELYLLLEGSVDLNFKSVEPTPLAQRKEYYVGSINPGEVFGISALIEPHQLTATAVAAQPGRLVKMEARKLRQMLEADPVFGYTFMRQISQVLVERLSAARVQLAAAWAM